MQTRNFGAWPSPISAEVVTAGQNALSQLGFWQGDPLVAEGRPDERGRTTLLRLGEGGAAVELTPAPFSLRTRVNEYGGRAWAAAGDVLVGTNDADQRLYRLDGAAPVPLTPATEGRLRFADMAIDLRRGRVIAVMEDHRVGGEPATSIVAVPLDGGGVMPISRGHDFFAYPRLSPNGAKLAWIAWDHPEMPWDATTLYVADLGPDGGLANVRAIAGGQGESLLQPEWVDDTSALYLSDRTGHWRLYVEKRNAEARCVWPGEADMAYPLWQLGMRWYAPLPDGTVLATYVERGTWRLARLDLEGGATEIPLDAVEIADIAVDGDKVALLAGFAERPVAVLRLDLATNRTETLRSAGRMPVDPAWIARARPIDVPSKGGRTAHAYYYPPTNPEVRAPEGSLPPLIVRSHGGPTSCANLALKLAWQFWTSRGFALVDVDYAGSTGYGRAYREALNGAWGVADVEDCVATAKHLVERGLADPKRLIIAGGSAGGYTTLAALAFADTFKAGASSYGVGDLRALMQETHKFESHYLDSLIGPWPEAKELYDERSPIRHVERLNCPIIFFQGGEDKVVPPSQTEAMVQALDAKGLPVAYVLFPDEGHGFRRGENRVRALQAEYAFYCRVFGIEADGAAAPLDIRNLQGEGAR